MPGSGFYGLDAGFRRHDKASGWFGARRTSRMRCAATAYFCLAGADRVRVSILTSSPRKRGSSLERRTNLSVLPLCFWLGFRLRGNDIVGADRVRNRIHHTSSRLRASPALARARVLRTRNHPQQRSSFANLVQGQTSGCSGTLLCLPVFHECFACCPEARCEFRLLSPLEIHGIEFESVNEACPIPFFEMCR